MQNSGFESTTSPLTGGVVPDSEGSQGSSSCGHFTSSSLGSAPSVPSTNINQKDTMNTLTLGTGPEVLSPITVTTTTTPATGTPRAPSPSPSEASTGSSNNSLDLMRCKKCSVESCQELLMVSSKRRKAPVMCTYHRNKTYKAKKKQKDQIATSYQMIKKKHEDLLPKPTNLQAILNGSEDQSSSSDGPPRLDQVLNEKKLALLRSPAIIQFLRESQQQLSNSHLQEAKPPPPQTPTPSHGRTSAPS